MEEIIIYSTRQRPIELIAHERLLVRLPNHHEKHQLIRNKVYQYGAGYSGELEVDRILPEIGLPEGHSIMKGITLEVIPNFNIQIDTLIITRHGIIPLEIKRYSGTVYFDEDAGKTIKISLNKEVEKYDCAVHQIDRAVHGLQRILANFPIPIPIHPILVMANTHTDIAQYPQSIPVKYTKQLPKYIRQLLSKTEIISEQTQRELTTFLQSHIQERDLTPLCERYTIQVTDLRQGVLCVHCNNMMERSQGRSWTCDQCHFTSPSAVEQTVLDWFQLVHPTLTNKQLRQFLNINSKSATRVFQQLKLQKIGKSAKVHYVLRKNHSSQKQIGQHFDVPSFSKNN